ncbi:hypothetical protein MO973_19290 [Paenibacillus sp. TRM 82003]|nr:hypothetical protein [Paenibacillus sp. TRM 82003]
MMFLLKLVLMPLVLVLADLMMIDVFFPSLWSAIAVGAAIAVLGYVVEWAMLRRGTLWLTTVADWALASAVVYLAPYVFPGAYVSLVGALLAGGLAAIPEYFMHRAIIGRRWRARYS